jgi:broad specificity phosphatase PhoE
MNVSSTVFYYLDSGIEQAEQLQQKVLLQQFFVNSSQATDPLVQDFINADAVITSPLTRAIQTALITTLPMIHRLGEIQVNPNAREKKNLGGQDSQGQARGTGIQHRVMHELRDVGFKPAIFEDASVAIDTSQVDYGWWDSIKESRLEVRNRLAEFMNQIRWSPHYRIVLVGHSHFFRELFRLYLHPSFSKRSPDIADDLTTHVIQNCGVACLKLDFFYERMIMDVEFMFDSVMVRKAQKKNRFEVMLTRMRASSKESETEAEATTSSTASATTSPALRSADIGNPKANERHDTLAPTNSIVSKPGSDRSMFTSTLSLASTTLDDLMP